MIVLDTSVWFDLFNREEHRNSMARELFGMVAERNIPIVEPKVFEVELAGLITRRYGREKAAEAISIIKDKVIILPNPDIIAYKVALNTGCRAVDAYFTAIAKLLDSMLITNDRIMADNARKSDVEAYYLIEDFGEVMERLG